MIKSNVSFNSIEFHIEFIDVSICGTTLYAETEPFQPKTVMHSLSSMKWCLDDEYFALIVTLSKEDGIKEIIYIVSVILSCKIDTTRNELIV